MAYPSPASTSTNTTTVDDAGRFIDQYLRHNDLLADLSSSSLATVLERADKARELFKKSRPKDDTVIDHSSLTQSQKYRRRLENNKKSAAATRVFNEVLRKESARVLRDLEVSERRAKEELLRVETRLAFAEQQLERLREKSSAVLLCNNSESFNTLPSPTSTHPYFDQLSTLHPIHNNPPLPRPMSTIPEPRTSITSSEPLLSFRPPIDINSPRTFRLPPVPVIQKVSPVRRCPSGTTTVEGDGCISIPTTPSQVAEHATAAVLASLRKSGTVHGAENDENSDYRTHSR